MTEQRKNSLKTVTTILSIIILLYFGTYFIFKNLPRNHFIKVKEQPNEVMYQIDGISGATNALWTNETTLLITTINENDYNVYTFNIFNHELRNIKQTNTPIVPGVENNNLIYCSWTNYEINSPEEIATKITITNVDGQTIGEYKSNETVKPINCDSKIIYAETSLPFLEKQYFKINLLEKQLNEITEVDIVKRFEPASDQTKKSMERTSKYGYEHKQIVNIISNRDNSAMAYICKDGRVLIYNNLKQQKTNQ